MVRDVIDRDKDGRGGERRTAQEGDGGARVGATNLAEPQAGQGWDGQPYPSSILGTRQHSPAYQGSVFNELRAGVKPAHRAQAIDATGTRSSARLGPDVIDMPEVYVGTSGAKALADFVSKTERDVAAVAAGIDSVPSAHALVAAGCKRILDSFREVEVALDHSPPKADHVRAHMQRLDAAIGKLFTVARQHRVPMRETGLEAVFDHEDHLRVRRDISYGGRANRAVHYYDEDFGATQRDRGPTPDGATVARDVRAGAGADEPDNRDELIGRIEGLQTEMWGALENAYVAASAAINEPEMPRDPSLLERLAQMAVGVLIAQANTAVGGILDVAVSGAKAKRVLAGARSSLRERVGKDTAKALMTGFATAGKSAVTEGATAGIEHLGKSGGKKPALQAHGGFNPSGLAVSPKQIYLVSAHARTSQAKVATAKAFIQLRSKMLRLPVETLRELHESFDAGVFHLISKSFRGLLVQEWVNFVKMASNQGYEMRDEATRDREFGAKESTKLDNVLLPAGVVRIRVAVAPDGQVTFKDVSLPGVTASVRHEIKKLDKPLSSLAMHRRIELAAPSAIALGGGGFDVDPSGEVSGIHGIQPHARAAVAAIAHPLRSVVFSDSDVHTGALALVQKLHMYTTDAIPEAK